MVTRMTAVGSASPQELTKSVWRWRCAPAGWRANGDNREKDELKTIVGLMEAVTTTCINGTPTISSFIKTGPDDA